ncbi:hypothetical protein AMIS_55880 [Actinoplanes missouriensis 431]|uniref:Lipoprotein n=1 Tax=Actinoplanes missouriensis (strain ATCC 14538 / DSM 43046 / CBS 188.64 / JCM 3121 / NBRC 102363 / NCIMB 12654 / NRRL B-3342 / UNCC 431) TaxID=512565 RepID=I0HCS1_ACTM4|nr:hypothetical protein AMIS_55880 [Actinoplanes missouriensis 431]
MRWLSVSVCLLLIAGCGFVEDRSDAAAAVASSFLTAVAERDGAAACGVLAPATAEKIGEDCAEGVLSEPLPAPSPVTDARVYGQRALVRLGDETVFLGMFPGGWRVVAAGCTPQGDRPYDCVVEG